MDGHEEVIVTARMGTSADLFPGILSLYVKEGSVVADVTYGRGVFWRNVDKSRYRLLRTDIKTGVDMRRLPYEGESIDAVVIDPPYMYHSGSAHKKQQFDKYANDERSSRGVYGVDLVNQMFFDALGEASSSQR